MAISFQNEGIQFKLQEKTKLKHWIEQIITKHGKIHSIKINFIFCSDDYLNRINKTYLKHDSFTDIITFDYAEEKDKIEADILISIERITDNSEHYKIPFFEELRRVMAHGVLHLLGFKDKTKVQREIMSEKENECLTLFNL
jgi:probable rRNA maturation factor